MTLADRQIHRQRFTPSTVVGVNNGASCGFVTANYLVQSPRMFAMRARARARGMLGLPHDYMTDW